MKKEEQIDEINDVDEINNELAGLRDFVAPCRFCQQFVAFKWDAKKEVSDEEKTEQATLNCNCESAKWYQDRMTKINTAQMNIAELFSDPDEHELQLLLLSATAMIVDKNIFKISVIARNGAKGDFTISSSGKIKIKRTEATVTEASL